MTVLSGHVRDPFHSQVLKGIRGACFRCRYLQRVLMQMDVFSKRGTQITPMRQSVDMNHMKHIMQNGRRQRFDVIAVSRG